MRSIAGLFGRSPFKPLEKHMDKVKECITEVPPLFDAVYNGDFEQIKIVSEKIIKIEHDADKLKNSIRSELPNSMFLAVDRRDFLGLLSAQDDIADAVEDLSIVLRFKTFNVHENIKPYLLELVNRVMAVGDIAYRIVKELDNLMEVSFRGPEAEKVEQMIGELGTMEWEADKLQFKTAREIFAIEDELSKGDFFILLEVVRKLGSVADKSEKVGKILHMFITS